MNSQRLIGSVLLAGAALSLLLGIILTAIGFSTGGLEAGGAFVTFACFGLGAVFAAGAGIWMLLRGNKQASIDAENARQRKLLDLVLTRGRITIPEATRELGATQEQVHQWLRNLVGMGIFSGYINWDEGTLFSQEAEKLRGMEKCASCGGQVSLAGKGIIKCEYCGTEYYLS
ncbi:MAG TPA: hypothetical protein PK299_06720 [Anaerolineales bacterium]|nr:hypothetical protein [Anaerolineales bacterium]